MPKITKAYIGLGSNLDNPAKQLEQALLSLASSEGVDDIIGSPWYQSKAVGPGEQPDYLNAVVEIKTTLSAERLLALLQGIEQAQGRQREIHWGARTLDLDLLLYGTSTITSEDLEIPHPRMRERNFVLLPLNDLVPDWVFADGVSLKELINNTSYDGIEKTQ